jgi:hypothetical protein
LKAGESGKYYADCKEKKMSAAASDDQLSEDLWKSVGADGRIGIKLGLKTTSYIDRTFHEHKEV